MRHRRMRAARVGGALAAALAVAALSGCGGDVNPDGLLDAAREVNTSFKAAVGGVQAQLLDDAWEVGEYGDIPSSCGSDGYLFRMDRTTPKDWRIGAEPLDAANALGEWMGGHGWTDVAVRTFEGDVDDVALKARNEAAHVGEITVDFQPGDLMDFVTVRAESTCEPGDPLALTAALVPGWPSSPPSGIARPAAERPDATPIFGFTEDGQPR